MVEEERRSPTERFFLGRLERFVRLTRDPNVTAIPQLRQLARNATLSAYKDCVAAGLIITARKIINGTSPHNTQSVGGSDRT